MDCCSNCNRCNCGIPPTTIAPIKSSPCPQIRPPMPPWPPGPPMPPPPGRPWMPGPPMPPPPPFGGPWTSPWQDDIYSGASLDMPLSGNARLNSLPPAMAYVPVQEWKTTYPIDKGYRRGTLYPELDLTFDMGRCR